MKYMTVREYEKNLILEDLPAQNRRLTMPMITLKMWLTLISLTATFMK